MGKFREYIEAVAINPLFLLPGETEESAQKELDALMRMPQKKEIRRQRKSDPVTVNCYRGFPYRSLERDLVDRDADYIVISPEQAQEGILWFTNDLQKQGLELSVSPKEYAESYVGDGGFLLTYPLEATKHYDEIYYGNGETSTEAPDDLLEGIPRTGEGPLRHAYGGVYELPDGWKFTWQVEKHIGCEIPLRVDRSMLQQIKG